MAVLPPVPVEIRVAEQTLSLTPLVLGELPAFAKAIQPLTADLAIEPDWLRQEVRERAGEILAQYEHDQ